MDFFQEQLSDLFVGQLWVFDSGHFGEGFLDHFIEGRMEAEIVGISEDIFSSELVFQSLVAVAYGF